MTKEKAVERLKNMWCHGMETGFTYLYEEDIKALRFATDILNGPKRDPLTTEQRRQLEAARTALNAEWLTVDGNDSVMVWKEEPTRGMSETWIGIPGGWGWALPPDTALKSLTDWEHEPAKIIDLLKEGRNDFR